MTFSLVAYNQVRFIKEAVEGALSQTYSPLEIILSDDCSTDRTFEIIQDGVAHYTGPHKIVINRNATNMGLINHVNLLNRIASGELIVSAAGDDISLPHRTERIVKEYLDSGRSACSIHSAVIKINEAGDRLGMWEPPVITQGMGIKDMALSGALIIGASHAWSKRIFEKFGDIKYENAYEDLVIGFRSALIDGLLYIPEPLVYYRIGCGMTSNYRAVMRTRADAVENAIRGAKVDLSVMAQRMEDIEKIGRSDLLKIVGNRHSKLFVVTEVWKKKTPLYKIFLFALGKKVVTSFIHAWIRERIWYAKFIARKLLDKA